MPQVADLRDVAFLQHVLILADKALLRHVHNVGWLVFIVDGDFTCVVERGLTLVQEPVAVLITFRNFTPEFKNRGFGWVHVQGQPLGKVTADLRDDTRLVF